MENNQFLVTFGGWYQRTTIHLSEVYAFLAEGHSHLNLNKDKLKKYREDLDLAEVTREIGYFEYVQAKTKSGITLRYYEDGLYIFEKNSDNITDAKKELGDYYDNLFSPAISYLFSLGAPTPKILANIKISHVSVVNVISDNPSEYQLDQEKYGQVYNRILSGDTTVLKTIDFIFVVSKEISPTVRELIETQIFFREFKDQLQRYLNIHRIIWEEISDIKEKGKVRGNQVEEMRFKLDGYQKTISLINNRINQMGTYANTRRSIAQKVQIEDDLVTLFQFRFEVLFDTLDYIRHIWTMTSEYVGQAIGIVTDVKNNNLNNGITSVRSLMVIGVMSMILGTATMTKYPEFNKVGITYITILMLMAISIDLIVKAFYRLKRYNLNFTERRTEFK